MRNRTIGINVRVNENEKKKLKRNAKKSGLNLSAYLRKCGLQQEIYAIPDENIYKDRKSTRLNSSHKDTSRMPSSA